MKLNTINKKILFHIIFLFLLCFCKELVGSEEEPRAFTISGSITEITCLGSSDGAINISLTGGVGPFTYSWSNGATTQNISGLAPGDYTVTVTDTGNSNDTETETFTIAAGFNILSGANGNPKPVTCVYGSDGTLQLVITAGTGPYTYEWKDSNGNIVGTSSLLKDVTAGTYTVVVGGFSNGGDFCTATTTYEVTGPDPKFTISSVITPVGCNGSNDGAIDLTVTSPDNGAIKYNWTTNGETTEDITVLTAGDYEVVISQGGHCEVHTFTVTQPDPIVITPSITNVLCNGNANGAIDLTVTGGTGPYVYAWAHGPTSEDISGLSAGSYDITITDDNGCISSTSINVTEPSTLSISSTQTNVSCGGQATGTIDVSVAGGTGPFTYSWSSGQNTEDLSGITAGNYTLTVTDSNGCTDIETVTITEPSALVLSTSQVNVDCNGNATGSIDLSVSGGAGGYTFSWSNGLTNEDISGLTANTYTVTVTDANGCTANTAVTITEPTVLSLSATQTNNTCNGNSNGSIDLSVSGGAGGYTYNWSNGATSQDIGSLAAGNYSVTVTDANGCTANTNLTITEPTAIQISQVQTNITCKNGDDGALNISVSGGTSPYTYSWSSGQSTEDLTGLVAGNYTLTVTDAIGCQMIANYTLTEPATGLSATTSVTNVDCNGNSTGAIDLTIANATGSVTYSWSNGQSTEDLTGLIAGNYTVTVTDDLGCIIIENISVIEPAALALTSSKSDVACAGGSTGSIDLTVAGGTAPYTYSWTNSTATTQDLSNLTANTYTVTVTDFNGCIANTSITISEPSSLVLSSTKSDISCNGLSDGSIDLSVSGGNSPYSYAWNNGSTTQDVSSLTAGAYSVTVTDNSGCTETLNITLTEPSAINISESVTDAGCAGGTAGAIDITVTGGTGPYTYSWSSGQTTEDIGSLPFGNYTVTVTDAIGCTANKVISVSEDASIVVTGVVDHVDCNGNSTGSIDLTVVGGTMPYTYNWSDLSGTNNADDRTNLSAGNYQVTVTDNAGCTAVRNYTITEPSSITLTTTSVNVVCNGDASGSINLFVSGGTAPYTYNWNSGAFSTEDLSSLTAGTYSVTVTDNEGCTANTAVTITQPDPITATVSKIDVNCNGDSSGSIDLTVSGGSGGYTYSWSNGATSEDLTNLVAGNYSVTITDNKGCNTVVNVSITQPLALIISSTLTQVSCNGANDGAIDISVAGGTGPYTYNWSNGSNSEDISALSAGSYTINVTDAKGCTTNSTLTITEPSALQATENINHVNCNGNATGSIDITVSGGTAPYTYSWSNGSNAEDQSALTAGTYSLTIQDNQGCQVVKNYTITEPAAITLSHTVTNVSCNGGNNGFINLTAFGGTGILTFDWNSGAFSSEDINNLTAGAYTVVVTDGLGCSASTTINVSEPAAITFSSNVSNVTCKGDSDGAIDISVSGGTAPYTYLWSNGATTEDISGVVAGTYSLQITDANSCVINTGNISVGEPNTTLSATASTTDISCSGATDGSIDLTVIGGTAPISYLWSNGVTSEDLTDLAVGNYSVQITDANGCIRVQNLVISEPNPLTLSLNSNNLSCNGNMNGSIDLSVSGGTAPFTFAWSNGETSEDISNLAAGNYSVIVTDSNGCSANTNASITEPAALNLTSNTTDVSCNGGDDGSIVLSITGGTSPYSYQWSNGSTSRNQSKLSAGSYSVTVTDTNGCSEVLSATINEPSSDINASVSVTNVVCKGQSNGAIDVSVNGGTAPYNFQWDFGASTEDVSSLPAGTYSVTISDANSCIKITGITISEPAADLNITASQSNLSCFGLNNGGIDISVSGGTAPYTYSWSNGSVAEDLNNLSAGSYTLVVSDVNSCTINGSYVITEPAQLNISSTKTDVLCFGGTNGAIDLTVAGGTAPYSYSWSNGQISEDLSNLSAGTYQVTVTDNNGCSESLSVTITEPNQLILNASTTFASCNGGVDGAIDLSVSGGSQPYTYIWSNGATTQDISALGFGNYSVIVTDANGCAEQLNVSVNEQSSFTLTAQTVNASCNGSADGSIDLNVSGGSAPFTYSWSNGASTQDLSALTADNYSVQVTDATGCSSVLQVQVLEPDPINVNISSANISCFGQTDGSISLQLTGGTSPYTISITAFPSTSVQATVSDANGCPNAIFALRGLNPSDINTAGWSLQNDILTISNLPVGVFEVFRPDQGNNVISSVTISEPTMVASSAVLTNVSCQNGSDGAIDLSVTGGTGTYTYLWSNGATTQDLSNLASGSYTVTINDGNGCSIQSSFNLSEPPMLNISAGIQNANCFGNSDGSINTVVSGGTAPYSYSWSNGATSNLINNLSAGNYSIQVTDSNGCVATANYTITQPNELVITETINHLSCFQDGSGSIHLNINGGSGSYTYNWSNGATTKDISSLEAGSYTVTISDSNGCIFNATYLVNEPSTLVTSGTTLDISCFGANDGRIDFSISGGTEPYFYNWSNGSNTEDIENLGPGNYSVTVTDANGCMITNDFSISEPIGISVSSSKTDVACAGQSTGNISLDISGGTPGYQITWDHGATGSNIDQLSAGNYQATITDSRGCSTSINIAIVEPNPIMVTEIIFDVDCNGNNNGNISVQVAGGVEPYQYLWSTGEETANIQGLSPGIYQLTVTDNNNCISTYNYQISEPPVLEAQAVQNLVIDCDSGTITEEVTIITSGGSGQINYNWNDNNFISDNIRSFDENGLQQIRVRDDNNCVVAITVNTILPEFGNVEFSIEEGTTDPFGSYTLSTPITFTSIISDNITSFEWDLGDGTVLSNESTIQHTYNDVGDFTVTLTGIDSNGCTVISELRLNVNLGYEIIMPTAFTPNGDNLNDRLYPEYYGLDDIKLIIYNNWGEVVFVSENIESGGWNGRVRNQDAPAGGYAFKLFATSISGKEIEQTGSFVLVQK